jgi:hypothetical protein
MKTLYESILDDEDVLVGDLKKDANNPFVTLTLLGKNEWDNEEKVLDIIKSLDFPKYIKEKEKFNKDGLGVQIYPNINGDRVYYVTYDKRKALGYNGMFPSLILTIIISQDYKKDSDFLMDGKIRACLGGYLDMKAIFGSNTPIKHLLKKWSKKYNIKIVG